MLPFYNDWTGRVGCSLPHAMLFSREGELAAFFQKEKNIFSKGRFVGDLATTPYGIIK